MNNWRTGDLVLISSAHSSMTTSASASASRTRAAFSEGDNVVYTSNTGAANVAVVLKVHFEDDPPFYTIHILETDVEKQTDEKNLMYLPLLEDEDEDDEVSPPAAPKPVAKPAPTPSAFGSLSLGSLGAVGIAVLGLFMLGVYAKNITLSRRR